VKFPILLCLKLWLALNKARYLLLAERWRRRILAAASEENVGHSSYVDDMRWKSTSIKVKDPLHERLLLNRAQLEPDRNCRALGEDALKTRPESRFWDVKG
jgi:hypothetical protein